MKDSDPNETSDWLDALAAVVANEGLERGHFLMSELHNRASELGVYPGTLPYIPYTNSIPLSRQGVYPGNLEIERKLTAIIRWNALAMVVRANSVFGELGGHIASYSSAAEIFEVGFNHFFRSSENGQGGDLVFFQPHSAPGIYARAFLEGRVSREQLNHYRREVCGIGLSSYPHPWLMPTFWQTPTGSMGIGPMNAIYQARFIKYLSNRRLIDAQVRHVWGVFGDGEMDEPESIGALSLAARERLDNLTFVINCNLQRLDGPVRGNGQIIQELESIFRGAGWNVLKVLWGSAWDELLSRDSKHALLRQLARTVDGKYQTLGAKDGAYNLKNFFQQDPNVQGLVSHMSVSDIEALERGGHDPRKLYAAFTAAKSHRDQPTVILAKTKKGYGMGDAGEARMTSHQTKKLDIDSLVAFRDRFSLPINDKDVAGLKFYRPKDSSAEFVYLHERRKSLGGFLPVRRTSSSSINVPALESYGKFAITASGKQMSTTMAIVRLFSNLLKDKTLGPRIVPIVADEARTFGMDALFRQIGIYSPLGQLYEPEDAASFLKYKECESGQLLEEGITEAGALSSWVAAATSYSVNNYAMLPFYIFYSMFGFQRVGDLIWAAADQRSRGFLIGATAGRTTLSGEGLQHQDGSSQLVASTVPNCRSYDPAFSYELAVIADYGARRIMEEGADEFFYLTVMNEKCPQPNMPKAAGIANHIIRGLHKVKSRSLDESSGFIRLVGSGTILFEALAAADVLYCEWQISTEVWSATSFTELSRDAQEVERTNRLHPCTKPRVSHLRRCFSGPAPVLAATDYVRAYAQQIAPYLDCRFAALGTDGFGRSDTRPALRRFFEVDCSHIVIAALQLLAEEDQVDPDLVQMAIQKYEIDTESSPPWKT